MDFNGSWEVALMQAVIGQVELHRDAGYVSDERGQGLIVDCIMAYVLDDGSVSAEVSERVIVRGLGAPERRAVHRRTRLTPQEEQDVLIEARFPDFSCPPQPKRWEVQ